MAHENGKIAILFNGPPRAGKDTGLNSLIKNLFTNYEVIKFTGPVKDCTHKQYNLNCAQDAYEINKDTPLEEFNGKTPREAYIEYSSNLKKEKGEKAVANLFVEAILNSQSNFILNPDLGDNMEALAVVEALGVDNVFILRIHKDGHDFSKDCRTWVDDSELNIVDILNEEDRQSEFENKVIASVESFLKTLTIDIKP